jgi:hypothetical protein
MSWFNSTPLSRRLLAEELAVTDAAELVTELLADRCVSRTELATRLDVSKSEITQRLNGKRNLSVRSLAAMLHELGYRLHFAAEDRAAASHAHRKFHLSSGGGFGADTGAHYTKTGGQLSVVRPGAA